MSKLVKIGRDWPSDGTQTEQRRAFRSAGIPFARRLLALGVALLLVTGLIAASTCDTASVIRQALDDLGEHAARVHVISPIEMAAEQGGVENVYGYAEPELMVFSSGMQCRYVKATVAHELAHVWQLRATGGADLYSTLGHDFAEIVADCAVVQTGWEDYRPYLTERQRRTGQVGCTDAELQAAAVLRRWAR